MSGKAYSLREMKLMVDYLTTNNLYGETRGRKMWVDFSNTNLTVRTWQSLKETFLKRILPDITNPYYRLDPDQIMSFKRGVDLTQKDKKLSFVPVNESKKNVENGDNEQPSTSKKNNEENATGEDTQCSKIVHDRASTETLILDTCYQTAEDIQRDLESTDEEQDIDKAKNKTKPAIKSVRDFIEYSEPLTPMLQEVLDDFATDEDCSDTERPMQIDENYVAQDETTDIPENVPVSQSILSAERSDHKEQATKEKDNVKKTVDKKQDTEINEDPVKAVSTDVTAFSQLEDVMVLVDEVLAKDLDKELNTQKESQNKPGDSHESSSALTDTLLPNNQEAVENGTFAVNSPVLPTPHVNTCDRNKNKEPALDTVPADQDMMEVDGPIEIDFNEERPNDNEPLKQKLKTLIQHTTENVELSKLKSPIAPYPSDDKVHEIHSDSSSSNKEVTSQVDNPCLQSVSLYAEQMITTKYSDSDSNIKDNCNDGQQSKQKNDEDEDQDEDQNKKEAENNNGQNEATLAETTDKVILLNSRSASESVDDSVSDKPLARSSLKMRKDKKLASVFGFSNGAAAKSRRFAGRKRTISHRSLHSRHSGSDSSEWTSTSDSEYVSPPHGRRNRYARKYLKPHSAKIMSLDEEGGLFVMLGKKIYPLVKDGKVMKNYVTYLPESDPEEDESYWKSKYIDERKRTADLKKKLGQCKSNGILDKEEKESSISVSSHVTESNPKMPQSRQESINGSEVIRRDSGLVEKPSKQETLKIKFTRNDQEVQLEGHWQHINPVLAQVVSMFHKEPSEAKQSETVTCVELSSGNTTPVVTPTDRPAAPSDAGVQDKINEMESEIFKEIEEKDAPEAVVEQEEDEHQKQAEEENEVPIENTGEENVEPEPQVTQRKKRGRPKKETPPASVAAQSVAKKPRKSIESTKKSNVEKAQEIKDNTPNVGRQTRSPRKLLNGITEGKRIRKPTVKAQPEAPIEIPETPLTEDPDEEVRYKFPSPVPERTPSKTSNTNKKSLNLPSVTSPDSLSHNSVNSSQGYQDSDTSPFNIGIRRRRRLSVSSLSIKGRKTQRKNRSKSYPLLRHISSESSNSVFNISVKSTTKEQTTINSEVYKSESYQLLIPSARTLMKKLESIEETNANDNNSLMNKIRKLRDEILQATDNPTNKNELASSSNLSLPLSPELSIVENLSVSKSELAAVQDYPTINEMQNNTVLNTCNDKFRLTQVDVSMPLMAQECALQESYRKHIMSALSNLSDAPNSAGRNLSNDSNMKVSITSESVLKNISAVNISSDSLDRRLEQLLLESAQKPANQNKEEKMEVDTTVKKKTGSRKRCSTPHKKKTDLNKRKTTEPIIEEESKAHCSRGGRRSCPPTVNIVYYEDSAPNNLQINIQDEGINVTAVTKGKRIKKDIIKVKIGRPKDKPKNKSKSKTPNVSHSSGNTEGDNESGVFLQGLEDSGDLIHNHSETCLQIKECMNDSVEFLESSTKSIISINSSSVSAEDKENLNGNSIESGKTSPELFCGNARCATHLRDARTVDAKSVDSGNTVYFTPYMSRCNSVMTEDLTPVSRSPVKSSNWYLLSDEESNTNYFDVQDGNDAPSYGANLKQLFPITCAVPDLSTITEMSERNDSQKASLDARDVRSKSNT